MKAKPLVDRTMTFTSSNFSSTHAQNLSSLAETNSMQGKTNSEARTRTHMRADASLRILGYAFLGRN